MNGWQDIATAPRDGSEIILGEDGYAGAGFWSNTSGRRSNPGWFWEMDRGDLLTAKNAAPTHWMPFPPPPRAMRAVRVGVVGLVMQWVRVLTVALLFALLVLGGFAVSDYAGNAWTARYTGFVCTGLALVLTDGGTRWPWSAGR